MDLPSIDAKRLQQDIEVLSTIGRGEDQGIYRPAFSAADMEARGWLKRQIEDAGLTVYQDGAANIHARLAWDETKPSVMTGSHLDSVPGGGHLDGALGVLAGLECLRRLKELDVKLNRPLEAVAFSDEEGRFGGILGSSAICGRLTPDTLFQARDLNGVTLTEAMAEHGLNAMDALSAARRPYSIHAFVELHIEQGPILEQQRLHLGVVDAINGLNKWNVRLIGQAAHAGATPMDMRRDAFQGLAEFACGLPGLLENHGSPRSVATIGRVELSPGAANVVPGLAEFSLDIRDCDADSLQTVTDALRRSLSEIARRRQLMFEFDILSNIPPVTCDPDICRTLDSVATSLGINHTRMGSGAAHDTQIMAGFTRSGLIFIPSKGGRSHSPAEWSDWQDIVNGANVLLNTLYQLANQP
ncbi:allantoate amidohydrolase [Methylomonas sp. MgM2]